MLMYVGILKYFISNKDFILDKLQVVVSVCVVCMCVCVCVCARARARARECGRYCVFVWTKSIFRYVVGPSGFEVGTELLMASVRE
jgi:hypothetical protein